MIGYKEAKKVKRTVFVLLLLLIVLASPSYAQRIKQITNNAYNDDKPQINDSGYVVWIGSDGQDNEIFLYDGQTTKQLTDNSYDDLNPKINDNGYVVWYGSDGQDYEIFLYDGLTTKQLTDNSYDDVSPQINNNGYVVWRGYDGQDYEIFLYDGLTIKQLTDNSYNDDQPQINDNGYVVWSGYDGQDSEIFLYDGLTTKQLTDNSYPYNEYGPQINNNGYVIWLGGSILGPIGSNIYLYDGLTIKKLTDSYNTQSPQINDNGYVVWSGPDDSQRTILPQRILPPFRYVIFLYDGLTTKQLSGNTGYDHTHPQINDNGFVVWSGDGPDSEIFLYDGLTTKQLTDNSYNDDQPQINDNGYVVWRGFDGQDYEIFLTSVLTLLSPKGEEVLPSGSIHTISWSGPIAAVKFKLKYSMDNGLTWKPIPSTRDFIQNTHYDWEVPKPVKNKKTCLIKVIGYREDGVRVGKAKSSVPFTIEVLTITAPANSEIVPQNTPYTITWTVNGTSATPDQVVVKYTLNNGKTWKTAQGTPNLGSSSFSWDVPTVSREKNKVKVKVILKAGGVTVAKAVSNTFTVQ